MPRTLMHGSEGPDVVGLQTKLNQRYPTSMPPLITDGCFGPKTKARVIEFQGTKKLVGDGIVGPLTWEAINGQSVAVPGSVADTIIKRAEAQVGTIDYSRRIGGEPHGWKHLRTILASANYRYPDAELMRTANPGPGGGVSWCGIFAVYCYQLANICTVRWLPVIGPVGPIKKVSPGAGYMKPGFYASVKPGDIGYDYQLKNHYFIIASINRDTGYMISIDGNMTNGRILRFTERHLKDLDCIYTLT